jgi:hypothetical protein
MLTRLILILSALVLFSACAPEPGSDAWCEDLNEKDKGEWTANEAAEYAKSCVF